MRPSGPVAAPPLSGSTGEISVPAQSGASLARRARRPVLTRRLESPLALLANLTAGPPADAFEQPRDEALG